MTRVNVSDLPLAGLKLIKPRVHRDERGSFVETYHEPRYRAAGIACAFVQDNQSRSVRGALRGLHYQSHPGQAKLLRVTLGRSFHVALDIRKDSPTFGHFHALTLDAETALQLYVPVGFAHGFCALSDLADVAYKVSSIYDSRTERQIRWDDPELAIPWPLERPLLSPRDQAAESFRDFARRLGP